MNCQLLPAFMESMVRPTALMSQKIMRRNQSADQHSFKYFANLSNKKISLPYSTSTAVHRDILLLQLLGKYTINGTNINAEIINHVD